MEGGWIFGQNGSSTGYFRMVKADLEEFAPVTAQSATSPKLLRSIYNHRGCGDQVYALKKTRREGPDISCGNFWSMFHIYLNRTQSVRNYGRGNKTRRALVLTLSLLTAVLLLSYASCVNASDGSNPIVVIYDENTGDITDYFPISPANVGIKTRSDKPGVTYSAYLEKWDGTKWVLVETLGTDLSPGEWHSWTRTLGVGDYQVRAGPVNGHFGVGPFFVIPELGTLMVIVASFGALAGLGTDRRLRLKR